jgi:hypothetical protein
LIHNTQHPRLNAVPTDRLLWGNQRSLAEPKCVWPIRPADFNQTRGHGNRKTNDPTEGQTEGRFVAVDRELG